MKPATGGPIVKWPRYVIEGETGCVLRLPTTTNGAHVRVEVTWRATR